MSDIQNVLIWLCETVNMCCDSSLNVNHFFVYQDAVVREAINLLTIIIEQLAQSVIEQQLGIRSSSIANNVQEIHLRIKLLMAYLQYPLINFFTNLKAKNINTLKKLILVFGWLIVEHDALKCLVCNHLKKSQFYDQKLTEITNSLQNDELSSASIDGILKDSGKLDCDLRQISNLLPTKAKLTTKLSSASCGVLNLDHLSLEELVLLKRVSENKKGAEPTKEYLKDLHRQATLIEKYTKVRQNIHLFMKWIVSFKNKMEKTQTDDLEEYFEFLHCLHEVIKANLGSTKSDVNKSNFTDGCSQLKKVKNGKVETETWLKNLVHLSDKLKSDLKRRSVFLDEFFKSFIDDT